MSAELVPTRVLIVDDEPLARAHMRELLAEAGGAEVIGECGDGREAVRRILAEAPDLVLLDVQIPELDGFGVVREIGAARMPMVIFVTAYDEYALQAFDVSALAYLLKPVSRERFSSALDRARALMRGSSTNETASRLGKLLERMSEARPHSDRLSIKVDGRVLFVGVDEIDWLEADDNHVKVHLGQRTLQVRSTMASFEKRLPRGKFLRIHRSTMVNIRRIAEVQPWFAGDYVFILVGGARLTSGRSYRQAIHEFMDHQL
jgi:two-component system LytT family response regulator